MTQCLPVAQQTLVLPHIVVHMFVQTPAFQLQKSQRISASLVGKEVTSQHDISGTNLSLTCEPGPRTLWWSVSSYLCPVRVLEFVVVTEDSGMTVILKRRLQIFLMPELFAW